MLRRLLSGAVAAACLVGAACAPAAPKPAAPAAASGAPAAPAVVAPPAPVAPTRLPLVFSTTSAANSPLQLGIDQGIFLANGLEVELTHAPGNAAPAALVSGQVPMMMSGCVETASAIGGGADLVMWIQPTNRLQYMLAGGPSVPDTASLVGKRLGVSRIGSSSHLATKFILSHLGLNPEQDVSYLQVGNTPERVAALLTGNLDATILSHDEGSLIGNQPGMRVLVDMTREPVPFCAQAMATTRPYLRDNPEVIRRVTKAYVEMLARYKTNRAEGMQAISNMLDEQDTKKLESVWESWRGLFVDKPYPDPRSVQFVLDEIALNDPRAKALTPEAIIDLTWVRELDQQGYIDQLFRTAGAR